MPLSTDNQDYGKSDEKNEENTAQNSTKLTSDDIKGKTVDADVEDPQDRPAKQDNK